jgi:hypothetical protein
LVDVLDDHAAWARSLRALIATSCIAGLTYGQNSETGRCCPGRRQYQRRSNDTVPSTILHRPPPPSTACHRLPPLIRSSTRTLRRTDAHTARSVWHGTTTCLRWRCPRRRQSPGRASQTQQLPSRGYLPRLWASTDFGDGSSYTQEKHNSVEVADWLHAGLVRMWTGPRNVCGNGQRSRAEQCIWSQSMQRAHSSRTTSQSAHVKAAW